MYSWFHRIGFVEQFETDYCGGQDKIELIHLAFDDGNINIRKKNIKLISIFNAYNRMAFCGTHIFFEEK
jgi:hypothetical protein